MSTIYVQSKYNSEIKIGRLEATYSVDHSRILRYSIDFVHKGLNLHKFLSAPELLVLQNKVDALIATWDEKYEKAIRLSQIDSHKAQADQASTDAAEALENIRNILSVGLSAAGPVDWHELKDKRSFDKQITLPLSPAPPTVIEMPNFDPPGVTFWQKLLGKRASILAAAQQQHQALLADIADRNGRAQKAFLEIRNEWEKQAAIARSGHDSTKCAFYRDQSLNNEKIDDLAAAVSTGEQEAIIEQMTLVLERSDYRNLFEKDFEIEYQSPEKTLLIEYQLPSPDEMPQTKAVKFVKATGELKESFITEREKAANYDSACFQICIRTLHEIFTADVGNNIEKVLFNGHTRYVDKATGRDVDACIMSIMVDRDAFSNIDLTRIEPKACFKSLKGVSASSLSALAPVAPILRLNKHDERFIEARDAIGAVEQATNLAAMDWEDFEHLVRGLFEKEFASRGGEVKITQSSSDGGVDAVAFDPDPITGGKIVIQAKRYTKTVGVSAVRDLYGTMQHESASRGILVTTAEFGPDAHKFSAGKPITLLTGANLLHLLDKHGIKAKIDIREARKVLNLREYGRR
jgi:restriction system protein